MTSLETLTAEVHACRLCADRFSGTATAHAPRPVPWLSDVAPILVAGQAPGMRVHKSGRPFDDASGDRLRAWMGIDRETFYDRRQIAVLPMAFCFPGYNAKGSDLPPPKICAETWRQRILVQLGEIRLTLVIGGSAQPWHLPGAPRGVTATVAAWRDFLTGALRLPHPSRRNTGWLKKNPWVEADLLPVLRAHVSEALA